MKNIRYLIAFLILHFFIVSVGFSQITGKIDTEANKIKFKANTVVYIEYVDAKFTIPGENPVMNQFRLTFVPHILPVLVGTTVDFINSDDVLHNVFSPDSCSDIFNLGTWPKEELKTHKYNELGCKAVVLCNVHPEMEAYVIVLQNPYFSVTDKEGNFRIENVPPGDYTLKIWNEKLTANDKQITVPVSGTINMNIKLKNRVNWANL